ncbi:MAG: TRAP transporter small permease subunit [Clostridiales Family XIII bacterium]|jgi:C4-dicarboxylate transporter DctQ subunit|nr:TRAP transporter small permease subunit [Clostridiales Family XIII bacterium]
MKYPEFWRKTINTIAFVSANMILIIAGLSVMEAVLRHFFHNPTSWGLNVSTYILIWAMFLGSSYAFQEQGHVSVDMLKDIVDKTGTRIPRRIMAVAGYLLSLTFILSLLYGGWLLCQKSIRFGRLMPSSTPIPEIFLDFAVITGSVLMFITLIFIILDVFKSEKYL